MHSFNLSDLSNLRFIPVGLLSLMLELGLVCQKLGRLPGTYKKINPNPSSSPNPHLFFLLISNVVVDTYRALKSYAISLSLRLGQ
jgi:hypothetical protein